ncbi:hypothetical protein [Pleionea sp. CnH1-48]|uniref:hypothetical protein n=1 Tax=Pleionea sp. CnH1-48 TaxID=2954494 RepID=UPI002096DCBE|nr:hypothetical protein [Pleionea sp. CnH1-48]MCO7224558.1 hypothetical protein [Pleionea sp. CnH1-48]
MRTVILVIFVLCGFNVLAQPIGEYSPAWSPDGKMIAYHKNGEGYQWDLVILTIESGEVKRLTQSPAYDTDVSWSPDSKAIVFRSDRNGDSELYLYDLETEQSRLLLSHPGVDMHPIWSPNGEHIAFLSRAEGVSQLYLLELKSKSVQKLTTMKQSVFHPSWSPDGLSIYFDSKVGQFGQIFNIRLKDKQVTQVTKGQFNKIAAKPTKDGKTLWVTVNRQGQWDIEAYSLAQKTWVAKFASDYHEMKLSLSPGETKGVFSQSNERGEFNLVVKAVK